MNFLLDTNVSSELMRPIPNPAVRQWLNAQFESSLYLSVISAGEIRKGFILLVPGRRRTQLEYWFNHTLLPAFSGRILPVTEVVAERWGEITATRQRMGKPLAIADGLIAATALEHHLTLVTRNVKDFTGLNLPILNPWEPQR